MLKTTLSEIITDLNLKKSYCSCQFSGTDDKYHAVPFNGIVWQSEDWNKANEVKLWN